MTGLETAILADTPADDPLHNLSPSFARLVRTRRSIRRYTDRPVGREALETLLTAAVWAPSAHNRQPWRFCVVQDPVRRALLSRRMADRWRADLAADGIEQAAIERRIAVSHTRLTSAAALIVPSVSMEDMDTYPDATRAQAEWVMAVQSAALACQNLLLAAQDLGLGACWMCAALFVPDVVRVALDLPDAWQPQAIITVGYPAETRTSARQPLQCCVVWR